VFGSPLLDLFDILICVGIVGGKGIVCLLVFMKEYRIAMLFLGRSLSGKDSRLDGLHLANNGWTHKFGTGQYIRDNIGSGINTEIGLSAAPKHDNGELVDDSIIEAIWNQGIGELVSRSSPPLLLSGCVRNKNRLKLSLSFSRRRNTYSLLYVSKPQRMNVFDVSTMK